MTLELESQVQMHRGTSSLNQLLPRTGNLSVPGVKCYLCGNCRGDLFSSKKKCCSFSERFQIQQIGTGQLFYYRLIYIYIYMCSLYCLKGFHSSLAFGNRNPVVIAPAQMSCFIATCEPGDSKTSILCICAITFTMTQPFQ